MLTRMAMARSRFTLAAAVVLLVAGLLALAGFPALEEPPVPVRTAVVDAAWPGAAAAEVEALVAKPLEAKARELPETRTLETIVRDGQLMLLVTLRDDVPPHDLPLVWQKLRGRLADATVLLPEGALPPRLNEDFGRVSIRTLALTAPDASATDLLAEARRVRDRLLAVPGVEHVGLHGMREPRVRVEIDPLALAQAGLALDRLGQQLAGQATTAGGALLNVGGHDVPVLLAGGRVRAASVARWPILLPGNRVVPLGRIARVSEAVEEPLQVAAFHNGQPAIVLGISMRQGLNVLDQSRRIAAALPAIRADLPAGFTLAGITDQAGVVGEELGRVGKVFVETVVIVIAVVVAFLGWRAGLVTAAIVPLTTLGTLLVMRAAGIELHIVSIAAIIIALGLFVDNGIVVVEDYQRRLSEGAGRAEAALAAGRSMAAPLLTSSLAIILAFVPLAGGNTSTAEYMRPLAVVLAITLLLSLLLALTVTPLLSQQHIPDSTHGAQWVDRLKLWYGRSVRRLLQRPGLVVAGMGGLLAAGTLLYVNLPSQLLSPSARAQMQMAVELPPGTAAGTTALLAADITRRLADRRQFPFVTGAVAYIGDGGPRFILGLNPPNPAPHRAYAVINLADGQDPQAAAARLATALPPLFPAARLEPRPFSLGVSESGALVVRLSGPDRAALAAATARLRARLAAVPGLGSLSDDQEGQVQQVRLRLDPLRAAAAGVSALQVQQALAAAMAGTVAAQLPRHDQLVPLELRGPAALRSGTAGLPGLPVAGANGPVPLGSVASVAIEAAPAVLMRRNGEALVTITARHPVLTAQALASTAGIGTGRDTAGVLTELGGEIEEGAEANDGLIAYLPIALIGMAGLFLWQFGSLRQTGIILVSIPFVVIGAGLGLLVTGQPVSFTATLGLLALAGIIVNNAVLLIGAIAREADDQRPLAEAIASAAELRLRPILMTKLTCIMGLLPIYLFGGALWQPMAAAMMGGLALGTLITLLLIPALYALLFGHRQRHPTTPIAIRSQP